MWLRIIQKCVVLLGITGVGEIQAYKTSYPIVPCFENHTVWATSFLLCILPPAIFFFQLITPAGWMQSIDIPLKLMGC